MHLGLIDSNNMLFFHKVTIAEDIYGEYTYSIHLLELGKQMLAK